MRNFNATCECVNHGGLPGSTIATPGTPTNTPTGSPIGTPTGTPISTPDITPSTPGASLFLFPRMAVPARPKLMQFRAVARPALFPRRPLSVAVPRTASASAQSSTTSRPQPLIVSVRPAVSVLSERLMAELFLLLHRCLASRFLWRQPSCEQQHASCQYQHTFFPDEHQHILAQHRVAFLFREPQHADFVCWHQYASRQHQPSI